MQTNKTAVHQRPTVERTRKAGWDKQFWLHLPAYAAAGFLAASAAAFGVLAPFGVALTACVRPRYTMVTALGAGIGYLFCAPKGGPLVYLLALAVLLFAQWALSICSISPHSKAAVLLLTAGALATPSLTLTIISGGSVYDGMLALSGALLGSCAAYFFSRTLDAMTLGVKNIKQSDITSIIITFGIATLGLTGLTFWGVSTGRVLAAAVILLAACLFREAGGAIAGVAGGISAGLFGGQAFLMGTYGFGGLLAGVFSPLGRLASAGAFLTVHLFTLLASQRTDTPLMMIELLIAAVISLLPPADRMGALKSGLRERSGVQGEAYRSILGGQIEQMSGALRRVADTTRQVNEKLASLYTDDPATVFEGAAARVCRWCPKAAICWQERYMDTSDVMNNMLGVLRRQGSIQASDFPAWFSGQCHNLEGMSQAMSQAFAEFAARETMRRRTARVRGVVTDQFEGMALMVDAMGQELTGLSAQDGELEGKIRHYFHRQRLVPDEVLCTVDRDENMQLAITMPEYKLSRLREEELTLDLSDICERDFDLPSKRSASEGRVTLFFREKAVYTIRWGASQIGAGASRLCGDSYSYADGRGGRVNLILSDGMGSGGLAAVDSTMTSQLLKNLIEAGVSLDAALKLVNSALLVRTGEESLATIDITGIDLYTGKTEFYKAGAAPTFVRKGEKAGYVESRSMPVGILGGVGFEKNAALLREGDWIVMVSDGAVCSGYDWLLSDLSHYEGDDPKELSEQIANEARRRRSDGHEDDITVLAIRLEKGI